MNVFNIERAFSDKKAKKWDQLFWAIDLHDTVITGKYNKFNEGSTIFPGAKEVFNWFNRRPDMVTILWTSSHADAIKNALNRLREDEISFDYINFNPQVASNELCDFNTKFYFNVLLDDKAGFHGPTDWLLIQEELKRIGEWN